MDLIYASRYKEVCNYEYTGQDDLPSGIVHVDISRITDFFNKIKNNKEKYVVVSPSSDFGLFYQEYNHPALDLAKWARMQLTNGYGYQDLYLPARLNKDKCKESDKYSIKCWSYTHSTFNEIPYNVVKWFLPNCEIQHDKVVPIPFGIFGNADKTENAEKINNYNKNKPRIYDLYVNFQFYTIDRAELFYYFKNLNEQINGITITCKMQIDFDEYLEDLATHKFVLCPTGNGLDCYRTLECIYMGAIPILESRYGALAPYLDIKYPMISYQNLFSTEIGRLQLIFSKIVQNYQDGFDLTKVKWPYWRNKIINAMDY